VISPFGRDFVLEGYRLLNFVNLSAEELELVRRWRNHPEVRRWMYTDREITEEEHRRFVESLRSSEERLYFLVRGAERDLGVIYFTGISLRHRRAYMGIYADPCRRQPGTGKLLCNLAVGFAFGVMKLHTLKLEVVEDNERALRLYRRCGFEEEGRLREFVFRDGRYVDVVLMGILNSEDP